MKKTRIAPIKNTRQVILKAAIPIFARKGYSATSVQDILQSADLSKPTLYYYFKSKAGLFRAILNFAYDESFRLMQEAVMGKSYCEDRLAAVATALFRFATQNEDLMRLVLATVFAASEEIPSRSINPSHRTRNFDFIRGIIEQARKTSEIDSYYNVQELTHGILGAISHQIRAQFIKPQGRLDHQRAARTVSLFLNGARNKKAIA